MGKALYPSKYTERLVGASQYLADEICERIAKKEGRVLSYKYWSLDQWKKIYLRQVTAAGKLLQECDCVSIMAFLRSPKGRKIYSLGLKKEILEGSKKTHGIEAIEIVYDDEHFLEDLPEEEITRSEPKTSLWEKLS